MEEINNTPVRSSETIGKLSLALSKAQIEFDKAVKSSNNPFFKSKYADLATIINSTKEYLCANELSVMQFMSGNVMEVSITTRISHSSGEWLESTISGKPPKQDAQSQGNVCTYLRRYSQAAILNIAQEDDDGNSVRLKDEVKKVKQKIYEPVKQEALIDTAGIDHLQGLFKELNSTAVYNEILKKYSISSLHQLPQKYFDPIMEVLNTRIESNYRG
jgi:hypothetical protein